MSKETTMNLYVGNLPYRITEDQLKAAFEEYGDVSSCTIIKDKVTGQSKGFGFLEMPESSEAEAAISNLNGHDLMGRKINVNEARPREGGGGGGRGPGVGGGGGRHDNYGGGYGGGSGSGDRW
jgi:RNA recognition motif-containing protein